MALTWSRHPDDTKRRLYRRRVARIYPDYLVAWLLTIPVVVYEGSHFDLHAIGLSFFLLQSCWPSTFVIRSWNGVARTLSCETFFYLLFPVTVGRIERFRRALFLVPFLYLPTLVLGIIGTARYQRGRGPHTLIWLQTSFPPVRLCEFLVGIVLGVELQRGTLPPDPALGARGRSRHGLPAPRLGKGELDNRSGVHPRPGSRGRGRRPERPGRTEHLLELASARPDRRTLLRLLSGPELVIRVWVQANHQQTINATATSFFWAVMLLAIAAPMDWTIVTYVEVPSERRLRGSSTPRLEIDESIPPERPGLATPGLRVAGHRR